MDGMSAIRQCNGNRRRDGCLPNSALAHRHDDAPLQGRKVIDQIVQALELRTLFAADPDYRPQIEPLVLSGDIGLGAAIAGFAGRAATKGKPRREADPAALIQRGFNDLRVRLANWDLLQPDQRKAAAAIIGQFAADLPPEPLQLLVREINKSLKAREQ